MSGSTTVLIVCYALQEVLASLQSVYVAYV